jgi:hypothetical protein
LIADQYIRFILVCHAKSSGSFDGFHRKDEDFAHHRAPKRMAILRPGLAVLAPAQAITLGAYNSLAEPSLNRRDYGERIR